MQLTKKRYDIPPEWAIDMTGGGDNFRAIIFRLIHKADAGNLERLRKGFPLEVACWEAWQRHPEGQFPDYVELFEERVLGRLKELT